MAENSISAESQPTEQTVRLELERLLASAVFVRSERISRFLRYTVEQSLRSQGNQLKESVIGVEVYDRAPDYNPKIDPIVRNEARRLRAKLREYYETEGREDLIGIDFPKGSYAPLFRRRTSQPQPSRSTHRVWTVSAIVAAVLLLAAFAGYLIRQGRRNAVADRTIAVAVLPFVNLSADPRNEYFSDGLTEELINALTKVERLRVPARTSAFVFKGKQQDIREIGAKLNVTMVLEGSVRRDGDRLRITAQLNNAADGYHLWSETYDREMKDALAVQNEIAEAIAATLKVKLANAGGKGHQTGDPEAYNCYLKGRHFWNQSKPEDWKKAVTYFNQAVEKDPNYALAYAGLSDSWYRIGFFDPAQPWEAFPNAEAAAKKALDLDDTLSEAHTSLANVKAEKWDWAGAEKEFQRAIELNTKDSNAHLGYAVSCLQLTDRLDQALREIKRAQDLDPIAPQVTGQFGTLLFYARQYDQAIGQLRKVLEMNPTSFGAHAALGRIYRQKGMFGDAVAQFDSAESLNQQHSYWRASLASVYANSGRRTEAEKLLEQWTRLSSEIGYVEAMVMVYAGLGEKDEAFRWLEKAYQEHSKRLPWIKVDPEFDDLRPDPRFQGVLRKMGLE